MGLLFAATLPSRVGLRPPGVCLHAWMVGGGVATAVNFGSGRPTFSASRKTLAFFLRGPCFRALVWTIMRLCAEPSANMFPILAGADPTERLRGLMATSGTASRSPAHHGFNSSLPNGHLDDLGEGFLSVCLLSLLLCFLLLPELFVWVSLSKLAMFPVQYTQCVLFCILRSTLPFIAVDVSCFLPLCFGRTAWISIVCFSKLVLGTLGCDVNTLPAAVFSLFLFRGAHSCLSVLFLAERTVP